MATNLVNLSHAEMKSGISDGPAARLTWTSSCPEVYHGRPRRNRSPISGRKFMTHVPGTFFWFECGTSDAAMAKDFYTRLFGWDAVDVPMPGDTNGTYTLLQVDGADVAGLYELAGPQFEGVPSHWMTYVCVASADESAARAEVLGATIVQAPMDVPGVGRLAFFADPTGANIAVFQSGDHPGTDPGKTNLGWAELHTPDTEASRAFYTELFDWNAKEDPSGEYTEWQVGGKSIGGMIAIPPEQLGTPSHWLIYALVAQCDETLTKAAEMGA
ncbi:MAG: VOC family protein, partial [Woeseiaceae bacterium]